MKKDIDIPAVENIIMAVTEEYNETFKSTDHYVYLINKKENQLEMVLIVSSGEDASRNTAKMRHKIAHLPPQSFAKVEFLPEEILALNNHFKVSFFENNRLFEKEFILEKNAFREGALRHINILNKRGIILN
jgi:hypothetical protein